MTKAQWMQISERLELELGRHPNAIEIQQEYERMLEGAEFTYEIQRENQLLRRFNDTN